MATDGGTLLVDELVVRRLAFAALCGKEENEPRENRGGGHARRSARGTRTDDDDVEAEASRQKQERRAEASRNEAGGPPV